jgi:hypothetical protein
MTFTNRFSLPEPFVAAVTSDDYQRGDAEFTATELIKPSRILVYSKRHDADMVEDVSDRVWRLQGSVKHIILERIARTNPERYVVEQRYDTIMPGTGARISGQIDLYDKQDGTLYDYKETSVWRFLLRGSELNDKDEWVQQANINLYLMRVNDVNVQKVINIALLKDWKARQARFSREPDYPKCAIHATPLPMWSIGQAQSYINERVEKHRAEAASPPVCNKEERWQRDATFAVMRTDWKRAVKLCMSRDQAEAVMMHHMKICRPGDTKKFYIEERAAEPVRCLDFCAVQTFCDFGIEAEKKWTEKNTPEK